MKHYLKSMFIAVFPMLAVFNIITSIIYFINFPISYFEIGKFISALTVVVFFAGLFIKPTARTSENLNGFSFIIFIGFFISIASLLFNEELNPTPFIFNSLLLIGWVLYLKWYSVFENRSDNNLLKVGTKLPLFEVEDLNKNVVSSEKLLGKATIYMFYRGNWCPLCMAQIKEIVNEYKELEKRGVKMVLISPQPHHFSNSLAEKHKVPFHFMTDSNNKAAKKLGIYQKAGTPAGFQALGYETDTVMPTVIITNKEGEIIFADLTDNYRVRPEPSTFLEVLDSEL